MNESRNFIEWHTFNRLLGEITKADGEPYPDSTRETAYSDMSRLVVAMLASADMKELRSRNNELGWGGEATVRPMKLAAQLWMSRYRKTAAQAQDRSRRSK